VGVVVFDGDEADEVCPAREGGSHFGGCLGGSGLGWVDMGACFLWIFFILFF
jgi:hypothetical protein